MVLFWLISSVLLSQCSYDLQCNVGIGTGLMQIIVRSPVVSLTEVGGIFLIVFLNIVFAIRSQSSGSVELLSIHFVSPMVGLKILKQYFFGDNA